MCVRLPNRFLDPTHRLRSSPQAWSHAPQANAGESS
jgi:hypothetical protein